MPNSNKNQVDRSALKAQQGFTLIELSIVLVIIGLIVGGVLVGKDLIEIAKARKQISQMEEFQAAANTFRLKYNCRAGDCKNATTLGLGPNGNGNRQLDAAINYHGSYKTIYHSNNSGTGEIQAFWVHLSGAGLITGNYLDATGILTKEQAASYFPTDALEKAYVSPTIINNKIYLVTGVTGVATYNRLQVSENVLSTDQMRYIHQKAGDGIINIEATTDLSLDPSRKIHPITGTWSVVMFGHAVYSGNTCAESDGSGGYRYKTDGFCSMVWRLDY